MVEVKKKYRKYKPKCCKDYKNGRIMLLSKCAVCDNIKMKFIKEEEARGLLSKLTGIKVTVLSDLPIANILI